MRYLFLFAALTLVLPGGCRGGDDSGEGQESTWVKGEPGAPEEAPSSPGAAEPDPAASTEPAKKEAEEPPLTPPPAATSTLSLEEASAQAALLTRADDVLATFLETERPRLRHAILSKRGREGISALGLKTFYETAPGLLDLPLPLVPGTYRVKRVETRSGLAARFQVTLDGATTARQRRIGYYSLVKEGKAHRVVWDRREVARARLTLTRGRYREAEKMAAGILEWSPACGECAEIRFWAHSRRVGGAEAWRRAGEHARLAVDLEPDIAEHRNALGVYYRNQRMYQRSEVELLKALELDPDSPAAGNMALLLEYQSRSKEALELIDDYISRQPRELWGYVTRCRLLKRLDRYDEAAAACRKAISARRETDESAHVAAAHYLLAYSLLKQGKGAAAALPSARAALEERPGYWLYKEFVEELEGK